MKKPAQIWIFIAFLVSVFCGLTGSSLRVAQNWDVVTFNQKVLLVHEQGIRSDERGVITALSLSQLHHKPPFPVVNRSIDASGKNMLIAHDFGVPVMHV